MLFPCTCSLAETYRQDFQKYAKKNQMKYLDVLFSEVPRH